jgi:tRNA dimethylallyltransferase
LPLTTRQLCKRQSTWLRNEENALILATNNIETTLQFIKHEVNY